jgi:hypothetical protein
LITRSGDGGLFQGDRGQLVDVPVRHAEGHRDQNRIVNLQISRTRRAGIRDLAGRDAQSAACAAAAITVP